MTRLDAALAREGETLTPDDLDALEERCRVAWDEGRLLLTIHTLDLARLVRAAEVRAEDDAEVVTYKDEVLRLRCALMKAERERDELRSAMERDALPGTVLSDVCRERDAARAEVERARRVGAEAMREAAAQHVARSDDGVRAVASAFAEDVRALPLPGDEP